MSNIERTPGAVIYEALGDVWRHYVTDGFALLGAEKPLKVKSAEQNAADTQRLRELIRAGGYGYIPLLGHWVDDKTGEKYAENSFLVPNKPLWGPDVRPLRELAIEWGKTFDQDSVVYYEPPAEIGSHKEHYKTHNAEAINLRTGAIFPIPGIHFDRLGDIYSELQRGAHVGRPFKLGVEENHDVKAVIQIPRSFSHATLLKASGQIWNLDSAAADRAGRYRVGRSRVDVAVDALVKETKP